MSREAMQMALEALEDYVEEYGPHEKDSGAAYAITALRQALETEQEPVAWADAIIDDLQGLFDTDGITEQDSGDALIRLSDAIAAVEDARKRYAAPQKQEPVAWANSSDLQNFDMKVRTCPDLHHTVPLYTAPPKREWVGLTDDEIAEIAATPAAIPGSYVHSFACAIEAKLWENNHG